MKYLIFFVLMTIVSFCLYLATYLGVWKDVEINLADQASLQTIYVEHIGPYHKVSKQLGKVEEYMKAQNMPCARTFGEYFDDPQVTDEARLRSHVGCIIEGEGPTMVEGLYKGEIPAHKYVIAVFTGSPGIGPLKVYPKVNEFMERSGLKQSGPLKEIYEIHSITEKNAMTTTYLFPVVDKDAPVAAPSVTN